MKTNLFLCAAALVALAACDKTVTSVEGTRAIGFEGAFVNNSVKAVDADVVTAANLPAFFVWGFADNGSNFVEIFKAQQVNKPATWTTTALWEYTPVQYWAAGHTYGFSALSAVKGDGNGTFTATTPDFTEPSANTQGGSISFTNDGNTDLLYDFQTATTPATLTAQPVPVALNFKHLLARVKFTAQNATTVPANVKLTVTNIKLTNVTKSATLSCTAESTIAGASAWTATADADDLELKFGNAGDDAISANGSASSDQWHYIIPCSDAFDAYFTVLIDNNGVQATKQYKVTIDAFEWAAGYSYNFIAKLDEKVLDEYPIQFTVNSVDTWTDWNDTGDDDEWFTAPTATTTITATTYQY